MKIFLEFEGKFFEVNKIDNLDLIEISKNLYLVIFNKKSYIFSLKEIQNGRLIDDGINKFFIKIHHGQKEQEFNKFHKRYEILSPIPGLIVDILVSENQNVKRGDVLFIIEAMKMRNQIKSPIEGIVKNIRAQKGKNVSIKELLAIIES